MDEAFYNWMANNMLQHGQHIGSAMQYANAPMMGAAMNRPPADYDLPSYYKWSRELNPPVPGEGGMHLTDMWKLPSHPTFSDESMYATGPAAAQAGHWMNGPRTEYVNNGGASYPDRSGNNSAAYIPSFAGMISHHKPKLEQW